MQSQAAESGFSRPQSRPATRVIGAGVNLVDQNSSKRGKSPGLNGVPTPRWEHEIDQVWRDDVALEMWIDVSSDPVVVRLAGDLEDSTGANLIGVVMECMAQGSLDFDFDISSLCVHRSGWALMDHIRTTVKGRGGRVTLTRGPRGRDRGRPACLYGPRWPTAGWVRP